MTTNSLLAELDRFLDQQIPIDAIAHFSIDRAIIGTLRALEDLARFGDLGVGAGSIQDQLENGIDFVMYWISCYSKPANKKFNLLSSDSNVYTACGSILAFASRYAQAWNLMSQAYRKYAVLTSYQNSVATFYPASDSPQVLVKSATEILLNYPDSLINKSQTQRLMELVSDPKLFTLVSMRKVNNDLFAYDFPWTYAKEMIQEIDSVIDHLYEFEPSWPLGIYTVADYRKVWNALVAYSLIHRKICSSSDRIKVVGGAANQIVSMKSHRRWSKILIKLSGVSEMLVRDILNDLTCNLSLNPTGVSAASTPFFRINDDIIALSNQLCLTSNPERNIWNIVNRSKPRLASRVSLNKESYWIDSMKEYLEAAGFSTVKSIKYTVNDEDGELDLFIVEPYSRFALVCELKWLIAPDSIKLIHSTDTQIEKGIRQALKARDWLKSQPAYKHQRLRKFDLQNLEIKPLVIVKNYMGSGNISTSGVPVISEKILKNIFSKQTNLRLTDVWDILVSDGWMARVGEDFEPANVDIIVGDCRIIGVNLGLKLLGSL